VVFKPSNIRVGARWISEERRKPAPCTSTVIAFIFSVALTSVLGGETRAEEQAPVANTPGHAQITSLTERLKQSPRDVDALVARGRAYHAIGDFEKEDSDLQAATHLAPQRSDVWHAYGHSLFVHDKVKEAIAAFDKAIALGPKEPLVYVERGMAYEALGEHQQAIASITSAIDMQPTYGDAHFMRAQLWSEAGNWDKAFVDYGRAIEVEPNNLVFRVGRANAYFDRRQHEKGLADVKEAMRLSPGDLGINYQPVTNKKLSPEALAHGEEQVRKMLKDRPAMAEHVSKGDKIWTWAVRKFAGEDLGTLIDWNSGSPAPFGGRSEAPQPGQHGAIQVGMTRDDSQEHPPQTFDQLWATAVFELHNSASSAEWSNIRERLQRSELNRDEYILAMLNSEERATQRTRAFYVMYFFPWLQSKNLKETDPKQWFATAFITPGDRRADLALWGDDRRIPFYGATYDLVWADQEYRRRDFTKVKAILEPLLALKDSLSDQDFNKVHYRLGYADFSLKDFDGAITEFTAALACVPNDGPTFLARGEARIKSLQFDQALADFNEALRLDPKLAVAYYSRGDAWLRKEDLSRALVDFEKAIQLAPDNYLGYCGRAYIYYQRGELKKSLADLNVVVRLKPKYGDAYTSRGTIHLIEKRYREALANKFATPPRRSRTRNERANWKTGSARI
jgi:tetratricopeptide (TPR) repeat protein